MITTMKLQIILLGKVTMPDENKQTKSKKRNNDIGF